MKHQRLPSIYFLPFSVVIWILAAIGALFFRAAMLEIFGNLVWADGRMASFVGCKFPSGSNRASAGCYWD
ncbi:MAG: hypothetical protein DRH10_03070 [Deltaproteobacteria bacterium]|nr:MAG: hypothetical protein DRH10_03070 [Deltaproteobacteria bacterium]